MIKLLSKPLIAKSLLTKNSFLPYKSFSNKSNPLPKKSFLKRLFGKEFSEIFLLCKPERKGFIYGTLLTFASSAIFMLFPQALSQITGLTSQKYEKIDPNSDNEEIIKQKKQKNSSLYKQ